eukprot:GHVO01016421.1.p1 GENE.GHVO01016421.1~~GHVO01016421.1.p1  ORF type:complete len:137 (-),score=17.06 GHVO01016421.1:194-604(-)
MPQNRDLQLRGNMKGFLLILVLFGAALAQESRDQAAQTMEERFVQKALVESRNADLLNEKVDRIMAKMVEIEEKLTSLMTRGSGEFVIGNAPLRLAGGTRFRGRLEVFYGGSWGTVCDDHFTNVNAVVICKALGLP